jgi:hypothetical protein
MILVYLPSEKGKVVSLCHHYAFSIYIYTCGKWQPILIFEILKPIIKKLPDHYANKNPYFQFSAVLIWRRTQAVARLQLHYNQLHNTSLIISLITAVIEGALSHTKLSSAEDLVISCNLT